jgi:hypothetical protein
MTTDRIQKTFTGTVPIIIRSRVRSLSLSSVEIWPNSAGLMTTQLLSDSDFRVVGTTMMKAASNRKFVFWGYFMSFIFKWILQKVYVAAN